MRSNQRLDQRLVAARLPCRCRTSSARNVGGDSLERQRQAVTGYAKAHGIRIVASYYGAAVSGADPIDQRPRFAGLLNRVESNGVTMLLAEDASRFAPRPDRPADRARSFAGHGHRVGAGERAGALSSETPTAVMIQQILGAVAQFEKAQLVAKLRVARDRKGRNTGRCEGAKPPAPEVVRLAKRLRRRRYSLRAIAQQLAEQGHSSPTGKPYTAEGVRKLLARKMSRQAA
jgi:DNA invertase Pin-like site-specific DNA recombinase